MIKKILIANRGEIACRIIKTAKKMGITTVAIYSDADQKALHTQLADIAYYVGAAPTTQSYLNINKIIEVAKQAQVDAIHPGYGFLSENTQFAKACADHHIIFIGPPVAAIEAMGSKSTAKNIMQKANVPLVPGYHGDQQGEKFLLQQAIEIGFPVMLKAAAGGGGKGMRVISSENEFVDAFVSVKREAKSYFGDDKVLLEKYVKKPRHIEIQIFADTHGNYVHLFERDCSIQRRHQKVIEEAPAPNLSNELRNAIATAAIEAAKAINYVGAGTIEFLVDDVNQFYFMEMNTRLQVEHPVTEMITGIDLVAWQIHVAAGGVLPLKQPEITKKGHSIEVRLYAEDPYNQFLPSIGKITYLQWPLQTEHCRVDTGFQSGDEVSAFYDPMLAKLIVWGEDRNQAIEKMQQALCNLQLIGIKTNTQFLLSLISHESFQNQKFDTGFIETYKKQLLIEQTNFNVILLAKAALFHILHPANQFKHQEDLFSPWNINDGWRTNLSSELEICFKYQDQVYTVKIIFYDEYYQIRIHDSEYIFKLINNADDFIEIESGNSIEKLSIVRAEKGYYVFQRGQQMFFEIFDPLKAAELANASHNSMAAPMPGTIIYVGIKKGDKVESGTKLMTMEAMKMEHSIYAPTNGIIKELLYHVGDMVNEGSELLIFEAEK